MVLAILGAGGHGRVVADAAEQAGWKSIMFFDDRWPEVKFSGQWQIVGRLSDFQSNASNYTGVVVAIGANTVRKHWLDILQKEKVPLVSIVHPKAVVSSYASLGEGSVVFANVVINAGAQIGRGGIVNTSSSIDHDCLLGDIVHVSPGVHLGGNVTVGDLTWIGLGASIKHQVVIGERVMVGAGAVVVADIGDNCTVVGNPARKLRAPKR